jgi:flagellar hook-associated protein 1 FlgK
MIGLFGILDMGAHSLEAQQLGTEVTGQNLANVNNPAYARQRLILQTATPLQTPIGQEGTGVTAVTIQQVRNAMLDTQIGSESSTSNSLTAQQLALQDAEAALGEQITSSGSSTISSPNGLAQGLSNLFSGFQSLSTNPGSMAQRQTLVQTAQQLASQFNQVSSQLTGIRNGLNQSIQNDVASANQDIGDIASLNKQIVLAQASGGTANDLVDLRQQKLEDLSKYANITTAAQPNGSVNVSIGGVTMVSGITQADSLQAFDAGGGQFLVRATTAGTTLALSGGRIEGEINVRDGALATLQSNVDTLASQLISQVNGIYSAGFDLNGNTGQNLFTGTNAATIGVNNAVVTDPSKFQAAGAANAPGDNSVVLALGQLANTNVAGLGNQTFSSNYSQVVAGLGQSLSNVNDQVANSGKVTQMLNTQRSTVSGVSLDEEMTNLMSYQKAYEASAQLITTVNQMLQTVINMKTG